MKLSDVLAVSGCMMLVLSCSVKEDREVCPCRLVLEMGEVDTSVVKYAELVVSAPGGFQTRDTLRAVEFVTDHTVDVPRDDISVGVYFGAEDCVDDEGCLGIRFGDACPPVYMHSSMVRAEGESTRERIVMRKNHCLMTIQVQTQKVFPFRLEVKGRVDGYESGGMPSDGDFMYAMYTGEDGSCSLALPRQKDASLVLEVHDDTQTLKTFALGEYVAASGYDWSEDDLKDIAISLDYALTKLIISIEDWEREYVFDVVI